MGPISQAIHAFEDVVSAIGLPALVISIGAAALCIYGIVLGFYRVYIDPLKDIPGPKLAAATRWYEFYYDVIKQGKYVYKIEEMHKKYGPIIRINPYEVVVNDADFYNQVYVAANTRRTGIWPRYRKGIGFDGSHTMTENHELHRRRRKPLEPYFSRQGIDRVEDVVTDEVKLMSTRLEAMKGTKAIVRLDHVFSALAGDVICRICAEAPPTMMNQPEFGKEWHNLIERIVNQLLLFMHFPELVTLARLIPTSFLMHWYPGAAGFNQFRQLAAQHIEDAKAERLDPSKVSETATRSIFRHIISSDMPESERDTERLSREAMVLFGAGTATTARTMGFMSFYILQDPKMKERLQNELRDAMSDYPDTLPRMIDLEKLAYLQAIIKEGLRLSYGVMRRLPRTSPDVALRYKDFVIPKNTPVGMSAYSLHTDPDVYPEPFSFIPERWLGDIDPRMNRNWVPFARGSRNCLGINLAMAEMSFAMAVLFRPGGPDISLYETDESDIAQAVDFLMPLPKLDSRGTRIMVN